MLKKVNPSTELYIAKGIAIFLVVLGHIVARKPPDNNEWYVDLKNWIYLFHMPFFMFLSGFSFYYYQRKLESKSEYFEFLKDKGRRILPGFFILGIVITLGKYFVADYVKVDNPVLNLQQSLINLIVTPLNSASTSLWYIYTLYLYFLFWVPLLMLLKWNTVPLLLAGGVLHFIPSTQFFCISRLFEYWFIFSLGCIAAKDYRKFLRLLDKYRYVFIVIFVTISVLGMGYENKKLVKLSLGLFSVPVLYGLSLSLKDKFFFSQPWLLFGKNTFVIYLFNTLLIGLAKAILAKFFSWDGINFYIYAPLLLLAGVCGPLILKKYIFSRFRHLDKITG